MSFIDLSRKQDNGPEVATAKPEATVSYPGLHLDVEKSPDLKLNTEITATVKLKVRGFRQETYGKKLICLDFDVLAIDLGEPKKNSAAEDLEDAITGSQKELDKD